MHGVPSPRHERFVLCLFAAFLLFASCATNQTVKKHFDEEPDPDTSVCYAKEGSAVPKPTKPEVPVVCIDDRDMSKPIQLHEKTVIAKHGTRVRWMTVTGTGSITVIFDNATPVDYIRCGQNRGFCETSIIGGHVASRSYDYTAIVTSGGRRQTVDPTVQVDPGVVVWGNYR